MKLYSYKASGNCLKVRILLRVLDVDYDLVETDIFAGATLTDEFAALNPARETPVLVLDDGTALVQSNAILAFLAEGTDWDGADRTERAQILAWCAFEQERIIPGIGGVRFRLATGRATSAQLAERREQGHAALDVLDAHLSAREWIVGQRPSMADIALYPYTSAAPAAGLDLPTWPNVARWLDAVRDLPRFVDDSAPYPANARPGRGRSIYD